jgi:hypothetical protein
MSYARSADHAVANPPTADPTEEAEEQGERKEKCGDLVKVGAYIHGTYGEMLFGLLRE